MNIYSKPITKMCLVNWGLYQRPKIVEFGQNTLFTGVNGTGKTMTIDALVYALYGYTNFNQASKDRDRNVLAYVRGDNKGEENRYLRGEGTVISYILIEFYNPLEDNNFVVGVGIESADVSHSNSYWFVFEDTKIADIRYTSDDGNTVYPHYELTIKGNKVTSDMFYNRERGTRKIAQILGIRRNLKELRQTIGKMITFNAENNIGEFIKQSVLEEKESTTLDSLKSMRERYDEALKRWDDLSEEKKYLEYVNEKIDKYEKAKDKLDLARLKFLYQKPFAKKASLEKAKRDLEIKMNQLSQLEKDEKDLKEKFDDSNERYYEISNSISQGTGKIRERIEKEYKDTQKIARNYNKQIAVLERLQKQIQNVYNVFEEDIFKNETYNVFESDIKNQKSDELLTSFMDAKSTILERISQLNNEFIARKNELDKLQEQIQKVTVQVKKQKSDVAVYPEAYEKAKKVLEKHFKEQGKDVNIKLFAELVNKIKDPKWQLAVESFLGDRRFHIIIDKKYQREAFNVLAKNHIYKVDVVYTGQLDEKELDPDSAAALLEISSQDARNYANYLLGNMLLCKDDQEAEEAVKQGKGALTEDGIVARGISRHLNNLKRLKYGICLGQDAATKQLEANEELLTSYKSAEKMAKEAMNAIQNKLDALTAVKLEEELYNFEVSSKSKEADIKLADLKQQLDSFDEENANIFDEMTKAKEEKEAIDRERNAVSKKIGILNDKLPQIKEYIANLSHEIVEAETAFDKTSENFIELRTKAIEEYEKERIEKNTYEVVTERRINDLNNRVSKAILELEDVQREYRKIKSDRIEKVGVSYILEFRKYYKSIENIALEEAKENVIKISKAQQRQFIETFIAKIAEQIKEAKAHLKRENVELKNRPFGNDTYEFVYKERKDKKKFFDISRKLDNYMGTEAFLSMTNEDDEINVSIREFMEMVLSAEDETEFTDYRNYLTFDMKITDGINTYLLSKKNGSASNGEKQTPYLIILAASLNHLYPGKECCARLAFMDEAFAAFSVERIKQMVEYFKEYNFQVIYAAPDEKIGTIGRFMDSTITCVKPHGHKYSDYIDGKVLA